MDNFDREREKLLQYAFEMEKRVRDLEEDNYRLEKRLDELAKENHELRAIERFR
jgi:hypothetical protein